MSKFGAIILAAGLSSRMGEFKLLLPLDNQPMLIHVVKKFTGLEIDPIFVITGHHAEDVQHAVEAYAVQCIYNPDYATGEILSSLKIGLESMPNHVDATFITMGDLPLIPVLVIQQLMDAYQPKSILAPRFEGQRGHPLLLDRHFWDEMLALPPDAMPRDLIQANRQSLHLIDVDEEGVILDVDTPELYEAVKKRLENESPNSSL